MEHLLFLHGALGAKDQLEPLAARLKDKYIVETLNFSGHGGTPFSPAGFSIPVFSDDVLTYLKHKNIERVNIFGYSMGGYVAMYLANHFPDLISRVITLATKFYWDEVIAAKEVKMLDVNNILEKLPAFAKQLQLRHSPNDWKAVLDKTKDMLIQLGKKNTLPLEDYKTIRLPCLLLLGDKDKMITREETIAVENALPHGAFQLLPDTVHPLEKINVQIIEDLVNKFLK